MDGVSAELWQLVTAIQDEGDGSILMRLYLTHSLVLLELKTMIYLPSVIVAQSQRLVNTRKACWKSC